MNTLPKLRFSGFAEQWTTNVIGDNLKKVIDYRGKAPPKTETGVFLITARNVRLGYIDFASKEYIDKNLYTEWMNRGLPEPNDVCFTTEAPLGNVCLFPETGQYAMGQRIITLQTNKNELYSKFLYQFLLSPVGRKKVLIRGTGSTAKGIKSKLFVKIPIDKPLLPEQKKIADFLGVVDEKTAGLRERERLLTQYKKGVMQKIFTQTLRFKADDGSDFPNWEKRIFGEVFVRVKRKNTQDNRNVLTISAQQGLINQEEYFNKSVSSKDVTGYYLIKRGEFAYNKSYSKGYPMGALKRLTRYDMGVVSTLYICFVSQAETCEEFYEQYFEGGLLNRELHKIAQEGARNHGLLNLSVVEFFRDMIIDYPHPDEQQKIADFLSAIDDKITAVSAQIAHMQDFKKGLLQQMFV